MELTAPRLTVAGLAGDSGKTLVSLGLTRCLTGAGLRVAPFKKGPDYIDAAWLGVAAGRAAGNLDAFLMSREGLGRGLLAADGADVMVLEGNRGLFDGLDAAGSHSTAELAKTLAAPVFLVVDVTKMTRTTAALVLGCVQLDPEVDLAGVILNRVATVRQEKLIRQAVEQSTGVPVVGALPRLKGGDPLPGRHLGLLTAAEHPQQEAAVERAAEAVSDHVDVDQILTRARSCQTMVFPELPLAASGSAVRIGFFDDPVFSFYYHENLDALRQGGAELIPVAPGEDSRLPDLDALYLGGGFPEVGARRLAENRPFMSSVREAVADGLPVYAECGGLMYLARELRVEGQTYPMVGALDLVVEQTARPQGHGYEVVTVDGDNPFFPLGAELKGHEFHYSHIVGGEDLERSAVRVTRGTGVGAGRDGIVKGGVWASYLHVHALGTPEWAEALLGAARRFAESRLPSVATCV